MPVQVDAPVGIGVYDEWGLWGSAGDKLSAVATNNGDTSVIYAASGGRGVYQVFTFPFIGGVTDPVNSGSITAVIREYAHGAGHILYLLWGKVDPIIGSETDHAPTVHAGGGGYVSVSSSGSGATLALASVNNYHAIGFSGAGGPSNKAEFWCTQFFRTVSFDYGGAPAAGNFIYDLVPFAALIGGNLLLREMPAVSALMRKRLKRWLRPDEYEAAWRAWRSYTHPRTA